MNNKKNADSDVVNDIQTNGINSLYELLVKYNYPCFVK